MAENCFLNLRDDLADAALEPHVFLARYPRPLLLHEPLSQQTKTTFRTFTNFADANKPTVVMRKGPHAIEWQVATLSKHSNVPFEGVITCGRASNNDLVLPYADISKVHAYFTIPAHPGARWAVADNGSSNGTFVGGVALAAKKPRALDDEVQLHFGRYPFLFMTPERYRQLLLALRQAQ